MSTGDVLYRLIRLFVLGAGGVAIGLSLSIGVGYLRNVRSGYRGRLLPRHVFAVSLAHAGAVAFVAFELAERVRLRYPLSWRTLAAGAVILVSLVSLAVLRIHLRRQYRRIWGEDSHG